jgi:hypothetical protein
MREVLVEALFREEGRAVDAAGADFFVAFQ